MTGYRQYYTVPKAAELFNCSSEFLIISIKSGQLIARRRNGRYEIRQSDLINLRGALGDKWGEKNFVEKTGS